MGNPLFNALGGGILPPPLNNMAQLMSQLNSYRSAFRGNAQQEVQRKLNNGEISQDNLNQAMSMARKIQSMISQGTPFN